MTIAFIIEGPPRTKKTSNRIVKIGRGPKAFNKILPSAAHEEWFKEASRQLAEQRRSLEAGGYKLPIQAPVAVRALIYRERLTGDWTGYAQALADLLGWKVRDKRTKIVRHLGIIFDDVQIQHWDGTRLAKDSIRPRIEVEIEVLAVEQLDLITQGAQ